MTTSNEVDARLHPRGKAMRRLGVVAVVIGVALPSAAAASVGLASITSRINAGAYETMTVVVSPAATCSIIVNYKSGPSQAAGLYAQRGGRISWTWKVGTRTTPGRWGIDVSCGRAGTLHTAFAVR
jgi:hypothetical protein